jgi:CheY-like chemotaxis protein
MPEHVSRVLVVDDEADIRIMLRHMLRRHTWVVDEAGSGEEAIERCREGGFSAIVLDQRMPVMTGTEVARQLRAEGVEIPIVLFSAYLDISVEAEAREIGVATISKENLSDLVEALRPYHG